MDFEGASGGLVNIVLGALILWVGQTTFQHAGVLAGIDHQFEGVVNQHEHLRLKLDDLLSDLDKRTQSRFTREDGDELSGGIKELTEHLDNLERQMVDRVTALQMKVMALETQHVDRWELARMQSDLQHLQQRFGGTVTANTSGYPTPNIARSQAPYQTAPVVQR